MKQLQIHPKDNVAVALADLAAGDAIGGIVLKDAIPQGHKFALQSIEKGADIVKYGYPIGEASCDIEVGEHVDEHKLHTQLSGCQEYRYHPVEIKMPTIKEAPCFEGYLRADGRVGIRNEIWIVPTVGCVNSTAQRLAMLMQQERAGVNDGVEGIYAFAHNYGCSQLGDDHANTRRILSDIVRHPNAGGVLVIGLGCENNQIKDLQKEIGTVDENRVKYMVCQEVSDEIEHGMQLLRQLCTEAASDRRQALQLSSLTVGLKCGGSDGLSGITANPLIGRFSDYLIGCGGASVLTEVPEMFGSETILMDRCADKTVFDKTVGMINSFKQYFIAHGQPVSENPSPGNKRGGISTLEEKSLGCTQKAGCAPVVDVLAYGQQADKRGLSLLWSPGNDIVATTALAAAGCQLILFSTGRGTPLGSWVPTIKISTNSTLVCAKPQWIDFNAGQLLEGEDPDTVLERLIQLVISVASGRKTCNEKTNSRDMAIFKSGVTL